ncbi:ATP-binding protein [Ornithinibacillus sp. 179-J 7C1 HS]|uniref:ATP-binding protein n=1 Tax=Ornithinibacillus sp. 179-J 7C1 HS TaxID=3142384 RepID=UPI0039A0B1F4
MENIKFTIEDREIAELLGRQNFTSKESAVFELLKNSYDAGAKTCDIYINDDYIKIIDDGKGMNEEDVKKSWMHVGKSDKGYIDEDNSRVLTGSKGVGRFALARLGDRAKIMTKKERNLPVQWETDWVNSGIKLITGNVEIGTFIEITELRDKWRIKDIKKLKDFLNRVYKSEEMKVFVHFNQEKPYQVNSVFKEIRIGVNYSTKISLDYNSKNMELTVAIESDEFKEEISEIVDINSVKDYKETFSMENELKSSKFIEDSTFYLTQLGDFSAELYFSLEKQPARIAEKFMYKYNGLDSIDTRIVLYRNNFSISSLDGIKDWLEITSRARKSPAAASHQTGSWRVRFNQIFGYVDIDKKINKNLKDLANRQGLEEDEYYTFFTEILQFGLSRFERHRQKIIRKIDDKSKTEVKVEEEKKKLNEFLKKPSTVTKMSKQEINILVTEIKDIQREAIEQSKVYKESEQKHKYDVRILNVLATQGLRASAIAHELHNKRNALVTGFQDIISSLDEYGFWEELNSEELTRVSYKNVPKTLKDLEEINIRLIAFLDIILNNIEKQKFNSRVDSIENIISHLIDTWKQQYNWIYFNLNINEFPREYQFTEDVLEVILDNLILNSIQHNEFKDRLIINIELEVIEDLIRLKYTDNGRGLHSIYKNDPYRILDVHESSRQDGHGLGMWIINNTIHMYGGKVIEIDGEDGFKIDLTLKG